LRLLTRAAQQRLPSHERQGVVARPGGDGQSAVILLARVTGHTPCILLKKIQNSRNILR
jgi:hypothetical protein